MSRHLLIACTLGLATVASVVVAQNPPDQGQNQGQNQGGQGGNRGGGQGGGQGGGRGQWNPEEMQRRMMERVKEEMKAPDDEWNIIQPKLEKVMSVQRDLRGGGFGGRGRGGGGGDQQQDTGPVASASRELRTVLQTEGSTDDQIAAKLTAYREARTKAETELKTARTSLMEVLSPRQEAVLVMMGTLE
jgi:hypothetical protein